MNGLSTAAVVGAGLLVLAVTAWLLLCLRTRQWRAAAVGHLARARPHLAAGRRAWRAVEQRAPLYPLNAPLPYGPLARQLHQTLGQTRAAYVAAADACTRLGRHVEAAPGRGGRLALLALGLEWRHWRRGFSEGEALAAAVRDLEAATTRAQAALTALRDIPRAALQRSRELHRTCDQIAETVPDLYAAGFGGATLDQAVAEARALCGRLAELPGWCVPAREMASLADATQDSTAAAWQILGQVETPLRAALEQLQGWLVAYEQAGRALRSMQQALQTAGQRLRQLPPRIDASGEMERLGGLIEQATALETRYQAPQLEGLPSLQARIDDLLAAAELLVGAAESAERDDTYLRQAIPGNTLALRGLANRMAEAAQATVCPLDWEGWGERLRQLSWLEQEIGPAEGGRTLAQLKGHADLAAQLAEEVETLEREVRDVLRSRDEWIARTGRPEMALPLLWLGQAQELHRQAERYAPVNWPRDIHVPGILQSARDLEAQYRRLMPARPDLPLPASTLTDRLGRLQELMAKLDELARELGLANERLAELQAATGQAQRELERVDTVMDDLSGEVDRVQPPFGSAAAHWQRALRQAYRRGDRLAASLEGKQRRRVEDLVGRVNAWSQDIHRLMAAWAGAVEGEVQDAVQGLRQEVVALETMASFDREPAMAEARAQLAAHREPGGRPTGHPARDPVPLEDLATQGRKLLAQRARLHAAREALGTQIGARLHADQERLERVEREARAGYDALRERQRECRAGWPPLRCDTGSVDQEQARLEREREHTRRVGSTVREVQDHLRRMADGWQALARQVQAQEEQVRAEWQDLQGRVKRLEAWQEQLRAYRRAHRDERDLVDALDERLDEISSRTRRAQRRYRQSELAADEARRVLDELWSAARADLRVRGRPGPLTAAEIESQG